VIDKISPTLIRITQDDEQIISLMQSAGVYEQMLEHQISGQDVLLVNGNNLFIWSIDEYMCYQSVNRGELEIIAFMFQSSGLEIETATRH
jgi:hypothetical protein